MYVSRRTPLAHGVAARHLLRTFRGWYAASNAEVRTSWRRRRADAAVAAVSARLARLTVRRAFAALAASGRARRARLARDALLIRIVAATRTLYGLRVKRWVMTVGRSTQPPPTRLSTRRLPTRVCIFFFRGAPQN